MLHLTNGATKHLVRVRTDRGIAPEAGVRLVRRGDRIKVTFALKPESGDQVVEGDEIKVFVSPDIAATLDHAIIDARDDGGHGVLVFRRQAETPLPAGNGALRAAKA